jgi:hypothetical protein
LKNVQVMAFVFRLMRNNLLYAAIALMIFGIFTGSYVLYYSHLSTADAVLDGIGLGAAVVCMVNLFVLYNLKQLFSSLQNHSMSSFELPYSKERAIVRIAKVMANQKVERHSLDNLLGWFSLQLLLLSSEQRINPDEIIYCMQPFVAVWVGPSSTGDPAKTKVSLIYTEEQPALRLVELLKANLNIA